MGAYILKRLLLIIPTLFGILTLNFFIIQIAPGGPVEQMLAKIETLEEHTGRINVGSEVTKSISYRGSQGLDSELVAEIERMYGFDKPLLERYFLMIKNYLIFDLGESFYHQKSVTSLIVERLDVSISLGVWSTILIYLISIPLGIKKAVSHGSRFDIATSFIVIIGSAVPVFLFAILLIVLFAGGSYFSLFPLRGLVSDGFSELPFFEKILDYLWHIALPVASLTIGGFASLTLLAKNSFLEEINKQYTLSARAKGQSERGILYYHVFRNAMLIIISGFPVAFIGMFFTGSLLIEIIFSLEGLGLLGYEAIISRDYPVVFGTLYLFTIIGLIATLISDITYMLIDPRIDFERRV
ncbi:MAG: microcin C ABC transporter permease YejB [Wolinella sp.]